mmetsp:Transcript_44161/g.88269  ORF Transcript_44161/g.88269 Transcript_44161/m.88269 type:complete len:187 (-) Transcript_44161:50-610(-)
MQPYPQRERLPLSLTCSRVAAITSRLRAANTGASGKYKLISKSKAKEEYLLTDRQLSREQGGLGCLVQPNPHDRRYGDMKLFLRSQVEQLALQAWGSDEGLFTEKERRCDERLQKAAARKRKAESRELVGANSTKGKRLGSGAAALERLATAAHRHEFLADETYDAERDLWTKRCACGFEVQYERM